MLLERGQTAGEWTELQRGVEQATDLAPRWRQAVLTAPFLSTRLEDLLDKAKEDLLTDDGRLLIDLVVALRTTEVDMDPRMAEAAARVTNTPEEAMALALRYPLPRWYAWHKTLCWLVRHAGELHESVRHEAARVMEYWQEKSWPGAPLRREIGELAFSWLEEAEDD